MIFTSQTGLVDLRRENDWDAWYADHLRIMVTVPGIFSAQRFKTDSPGYAPSLAMYSVASAAVFDDAYYRSVRGLGEWLALVDRRYYLRNLFEGLAEAPAVAAGARLVVADREQEDGTLGALRLTWLTCVGLDRSTPLRGITVLNAAEPARIAYDHVAIYRPVTEYMRSAATMYSGRNAT